MCVCVYVYVCVYACMCVYMYVCMCAYVHMCVCVCMRAVYPLVTAWTCNTSVFIHPINGTQCLGLAPHQTATASACATACCYAGDACSTWVYDTKVYACMVWVYGCMVWVYGCMGVCVYACMRVRVYGRCFNCSTWVYDTKVYGCMGVWVYGRCFNCSTWVYDT